MVLARRLLDWRPAAAGRSRPPHGTGVLTVGAISTITDDAKYNAWPNVCRMANGSLILVYTKADSHNADNTGKIVGRISADDGRDLGRGVHDLR